MEYIVRHARTRDVPVIRRLINENVASGRLLDKPTVNLYEDILEFTVAEAAADGAVAGCGALHVLWDDLAEIRTVAVDERRRGAGIGHLIVDELLDRARDVGVSRVFVLTFAVPFFASHGFTEISGTPVAPEVYAELLRSYDGGVAEFLDLDRVKPNTLGNTRMLLRLLAKSGLPHSRWRPMGDARSRAGRVAPGDCPDAVRRLVECMPCCRISPRSPRRRLSVPRFLSAGGYSCARNWRQSAVRAAKRERQVPSAGRNAVKAERDIS
jgi:amino-acid N-acetyltransferase